MNIQIVAKRYAGAIFSNVTERKLPKAIWDELDSLAQLVTSSQEFANVIKNPLVSDEEKKGVFSVLNKEGKISDVLFNFISLLIEKKRLFLLKDINSEIKNLLLEENNQVEAEAVFAVAPEKEVKSQLEKKLSDLIGKQVLLKEVIDPSVIGGVKVKLGSALYDATIKGQLEKLKAALV